MNIYLNVNNVVYLTKTLKSQIKKNTDHSNIILILILKNLF